MASYGTVSNITYGGGLAVSWIAFVKQTGLSPLMPGQWTKFLAFYAGARLPMLRLCPAGCLAACRSCSSGAGC